MCQKWLTLIRHWSATFSNARLLLLLYKSSPATTMSCSQPSRTSSTSDSLAISCCVPALELIEWRLDYSLMCGAFLSMFADWVELIAQNNFIANTACPT